MKRINVGLASLLLCLLSALPAAAGVVVFEFETTYRYQDRVEGVTTSVIYANERELKMGVISENFQAGRNPGASISSAIDTAAESGRSTPIQRSEANQHSEMYFDADGQIITVVDHTKRRLHSLSAKKDPAASEKKSGDNPFALLGDAMQELQQGIADLPEDQRKQVEGLFSGLQEMAESDERNGVHANGERDTVDGRSCMIYHEKEHDQLIATHCVVDPSALPGGELVNAHFKQMAQVYQAAISNMGLPGSFMDMGLLEIDGISVRSRTLHSDGTIRSETLIKRSGERPVPSDTFEVPIYPKLSLWGN